MSVAMQREKNKQWFTVVTYACSGGSFSGSRELVSNQMFGKNRKNVDNDK